MTQSRDESKKKSHKAHESDDESDGSDDEQGGLKSAAKPKGNEAFIREPTTWERIKNAIYNAFQNATFPTNGWDIIWDTPLRLLGIFSRLFTGEGTQRLQPEANVWWFYGLGFTSLVLYFSIWVAQKRDKDRFWNVDFIIERLSRAQKGVGVNDDIGINALIASVSVQCMGVFFKVDDGRITLLYTDEAKQDDNGINAFGDAKYNDPTSWGVGNAFDKWLGKVLDFIWKAKPVTNPIFVALTTSMMFYWLYWFGYIVGNGPDTLATLNPSIYPGWLMASPLFTWVGCAVIFGIGMYIYSKYKGEKAKQQNSLNGGFLAAQNSTNNDQQFAKDLKVQCLNNENSTIYRVLHAALFFFIDEEQRKQALIEIAEAKIVIRQYAKSLKFNNSGLDKTGANVSKRFTLTKIFGFTPEELQNQLGISNKYWKQWFYSLMVICSAFMFGFINVSMGLWYINDLFGFFDSRFSPGATPGGAAGIADTLGAFYAPLQVAIYSFATLIAILFAAKDYCDKKKTRSRYLSIMGMSYSENGDNPNSEANFRVIWAQMQKLLNDINALHAALETMQVKPDLSDFPILEGDADRFTRRLVPEPSLWTTVKKTLWRFGHVLLLRLGTGFLFVRFLLIDGNYLSSIAVIIKGSAGFSLFGGCLWPVFVLGAFVAVIWAMFKIYEYHLQDKQERMARIVSKSEVYLYAMEQCKEVLATEYEEQRKKAAGGNSLSSSSKYVANEQVVVEDNVKQSLLHADSPVTFGSNRATTRVASEAVLVDPWEQFLPSALQ
jgi:hypothetical protein